MRHSLKSPVQDCGILRGGASVADIRTDVNPRVSRFP